MKQAKPWESKSFQFNLKRNRNLFLSGAALLIPYIGIAVIVILAEKIDRWAFRLAALPIIAAFQNHLQILLHEGAHFQLHPKRRWNDLLTDIFCSIPFFGWVRHYRHFHFIHHRHLLNADHDPEVEFYAGQNYFFERKRWFELLRMLLIDFSGYHYFQFLFSYNRYLIDETRRGRLAGLSTQEWFALGIVGCVGLIAVFYFHALFILFFYWILPQPTFLFLFLKLQGYGEHSKRQTTIEDCTYTHELGWLARFFIYPLNSDLHLEHHLYPSVPWYRLRFIHKTRSEPISGKLSRSYFFGSNSILRTILVGRES
jgi:fatty acid desaturase